MNTIRCLTLLSFYATLLFTQQATIEIDPEILNAIRTGFYVAVKDEDTTVNLMHFIEDEFTKKHDEYPAVILAYYAALEGLRGRHASNPASKYVHVSRAVEKMNAAVEKDPSLLEGRFLRFSFFHQIPGIFGVGGKVRDDLEVTISMLEKHDYGFVDKNQQKDMIGYLLGTERPTPEQRTRLENLAEEPTQQP